jgi:MFS family permease
VLKILYPEAVKHNNYSKTLTSVTFAGTIVGMLIFGWISDKIGRKFGMVRSILETPPSHTMSSSPDRWLLPELLLCFPGSQLRRVVPITVPMVCLPCFALVGESDVCKAFLITDPTLGGQFPPRYRCWRRVPLRFRCCF